MNIQAERSHIIEQLNHVSDINVIKAIKNILIFASKKEKVSDFVIPEWHKEIVRERIKNTKPKDMLKWDDVKDSFKL